MLNQTAAPKADDAPASLNTFFGLSDSFRKVVSTGLIAATAFLAGCARSIDDRAASISELAAPPVTAMQDNPTWFDGQKVMVRGVPTFLTEASHSYTNNIPVYFGSSGYTVIPERVTNTAYIYQLSVDGETTGVILNSKTPLPQEQLNIGGTFHNQHGKVMIEVEDHVPANFVPASKTK